MAITSEIIGKLGGADVEEVPVSGGTSGAGDSEKVLHTVHVPTGETWLIAAIGDLNPYYENRGFAPEVYLGDQKINGYTSIGALSMAILGEGTVTFRIKRNNGNGTDSFTGHVYTVKL